MKNIIEKSVIEAKLIELENEILSLEKVYMDNVEAEKIENQMLIDATSINKRLSEMIFNLDARESRLMNDKCKRTSISRFKAVATNM